MLLSDNGLVDECYNLLPVWLFRNLNMLREIDCRASIFESEIRKLAFRLLNRHRYKHLATKGINSFNNSFDLQRPETQHGGDRTINNNDSCSALANNDELAIQPRQQQQNRVTMNGMCRESQQLCSARVVGIDASIGLHENSGVVDTAAYEARGNKMLVEDDTCAAVRNNKRQRRHSNVEQISLQEDINNSDDDSSPSDEKSSSTVDSACSNKKAVKNCRSMRRDKLHSLKSCSSSLGSTDVSLCSVSPIDDRQTSVDDFVDLDRGMSDDEEGGCFVENMSSIKHNTPFQSSAIYKETFCSNQHLYGSFSETDPSEQQQLVLVRYLLVRRRALLLQKLNLLTYGSEIMKTEHQRLSEKLFQGSTVTLENNTAQGARKPRYPSVTNDSALSSAYRPQRSLRSGACESNKRLSSSRYSNDTSSVTNGSQTGYLGQNSEASSVVSEGSVASSTRITNNKRQSTSSGGRSPGNTQISTVKPTTNSVAPTNTTSSLRCQSRPNIDKFMSTSYHTENYTVENTTSFSRSTSDTDDLEATVTWSPIIELEQSVQQNGLNEGVDKCNTSLFPKAQNTLVISDSLLPLEEQECSLSSLISGHNKLEKGGVEESNTKKQHASDFSYKSEDSIQSFGCSRESESDVINTVTHSTTDTTRPSTSKRDEAEAEAFSEITTDAPRDFLSDTLRPNKVDGETGVRNSPLQGLDIYHPSDLATSVESKTSKCNDDVHTSENLAQYSKVSKSKQRCTSQDKQMLHQVSSSIGNSSFATGKNIFPPCAIVPDQPSETITPTSIPTMRCTESNATTIGVPTSVIGGGAFGSSNLSQGVSECKERLPSLKPNTNNTMSASPELDAVDETFNEMRQKPNTATTLNVWSGVCPACGQGENAFDGAENMVACDCCNNWFHFICVGYEQKAVTKEPPLSQHNTKKKSRKRKAPPKVSVILPNEDDKWYCSRCINAGMVSAEDLAKMKQS